MSVFARPISSVDKPPSRLMFILEGMRVAPEFAMMVAAMPLLARAPSGDGHPVLVLPGLMGSDGSTVALRTYLARQGFTPHGWGFGRNRGYRPGLEVDLAAKLESLANEGKQKVSLVGWSLGGIFARQLAKARPDLVRQVITLGSPFKGPPTATNAWRLYELASGMRIDELESHPFVRDRASPPDVPTTAILSRTDGVCAWRNCAEQESESAETIEIYGSHCGLGHNPAAMYAIADRLAQTEGNWEKFSPPERLVAAFPKSRRHALDNRDAVSA